MREGFSVPGWALANPFAVLALYVGIVAAALAAVLFVLPMRMMPYVESPLISVVTMAPGYAPQEVETYFSKPIEERMTDLHGVRFIRSISQRDLSIITLQFPYGTDMRRAMVDVQQLAKQAEGDLPYDRANLKPSYVVPVDPLNTPILQLSITGIGWDPVQLRQFVANEVVRELKGVEGVQQVVPFGGLQRQVQVIVDRDAAAAQGLSLLDVRDALDRQNVSASGGTLTGGERESIVRGVDRMQDAREMLGYPVKSEGERTVFLRDIAKVRDASAEVRSAYRFNGRDAIEISVIENPDASSPRVIAAVDAKLAEIAAAHPGLHVTRAYDNARFVTALTRNMLEELIVSVVLAGLVLLIFLEDVGATAIVMTSIPTCLGLALFLFIPFGLSVNSSTLVGLLLAIGRLVDDSIVVIHAVHRKIEAGATPAHAAVEGTSEVILPIAAATGVMVLAVVPLLTSGGITQIMFVGLVWPIVFALLASLLVSLTLTPLLAAWFFHPAIMNERDRSQRTWRKRFDSMVRRALAPTHRGLDALDRAYRRALAWSLKQHAVVLGVAAIATYLGFSLLPLIGSEMMPLSDTGQAYAYLEADAGASFVATDVKARAFEQILLAQPEVQRLSGEIGEAPGNGYVTGQAMNGISSASYLITFSPKEERSRSIWQIMDAVYAQTHRTIPGLRRLALKEMGSDVMATSNAPVELLVYGPDLAPLHAIAARVADIGRGIPGMVQVGTSAAPAQPEQRIRVDRARAAELGLSPAEVEMQAYYATHGGVTTEFFNPPNLRHSQILVRYASDERASAADLGRVQIVGKNGAVVPLLALAHIERAVAPTLIEHDGLRRSVSVLGYYRKGGSGEMALDMQTMMGALAQIPFPKGYGIAMRGDMTEMMASFDRLLNAMKVAVFFVLLLLVAQFRSLAQPLVMLLAIPLQILGVALGLLLAHQNLSTVSILGIVVANGMAVSNAILLLDLILHKRKDGLSVRDAILEAGPIRLRPILMTTIVSLVVLIPVAFFPKTGIDAYSPLATVIIGGLTISTVLTLFVVPVLHDAFAEIKKKHMGKRAFAILSFVLATMSFVPRPALGAQTDMPTAMQDDVGLERYEGSLTLEQAVARAKDVGYDVRDARALQLIASSDASTSGAALRPQVSLAATAMDANLPQFGMPVARQTYASATLSLPVLSASASKSARSARETLAAVSTDVETARQSAVFAAIQAYRRAQSAAAIAEVRTIAVQDQREHVRLTDLRIAAGKLPRYIAARDRAALAQAEQMEEEAAAERDKALADLMAFLSYDPVSSHVVLADPLEAATFDRSRDDIFAAALVRRPEMLAARQRLAAARLMLASARAAYVPNATLTGQTYSGASSPSLGASGGQIALTLSLPIADGGARAAAVERARGELERAQITFERWHADVLRDVTDAWRDLEAARINVTSARAAQRDAEAQLAAVRLRERAGKAIELEVLDALALSASARESALRAIAAYDVAVAAVGRTAGDPQIPDMKKGTKP